MATEGKDMTTHPHDTGDAKGGDTKQYRLKVPGGPDAGCLVTIQRRSNRTGRVIVRFVSPGGAYRIGDEVQAMPSELIEAQRP